MTLAQFSLAARNRGASVPLGGSSLWNRVSVDQKQQKKDTRTNNAVHGWQSFLGDVERGVPLHVEDEEVTRIRLVLCNRSLLVAHFDELR
jgi:hypothetical protein